MVALNEYRIASTNCIDKGTAVLTTMQMFYSPLSSAFTVAGRVLGYRGVSIVHLAKFSQMCVIKTLKE